MKDKYFNLYKKLCESFAEESKDPTTKVGALIVKGNQFSGGYNGFPTGIEETPERWERPEKYDWVIHAEVNAVLNCPFSVEGASLVCTHQPCTNCLKFVYQSGIKEVYFLNYYENLQREDIWNEVCEKFDFCGVLKYKNGK